MSETQREPVPRSDGGELDTAMAFLNFARDCLLKKVAGLSDEQRRRTVVESDTNLLGLIQHSIVGERWWFGYHLLGRYDDIDWDFSMVVPPERNSEELIEEFRAAVAESNRAIAEVGSLNTPMKRTVDGEHLSLRWIIAHFTSETARHAGHADILREIIDGTTGR